MVGGLPSSLLSVLHGVDANTLKPREVRLNQLRKNVVFAQSAKPLE